MSRSRYGIPFANFSHRAGLVRPSFADRAIPSLPFHADIEIPSNHRFLQTRKYGCATPLIPAMVTRYLAPNGYLGIENAKRKGTRKLVRIQPERRLPLLETLLLLCTFCSFLFHRLRSRGIFFFFFLFFFFLTSIAPYRHFSPLPRNPPELATLLHVYAQLATNFAYLLLDRPFVSYAYFISRPRGFVPRSIGEQTNRFFVR